MFERELTINGVLNDPLIGLVMRANSISYVHLHSLLNNARERQLT
ncbi:hypothetical protein RMR16_016690 [Agrobacterium sp. rho-13.3]|nr:hypothetical protein [Agrobacterium sp. rho-13.3]MDX8309324.1 hypothetical protein [Agrobacterium sp. rho-13.3]